MLSIRPPFADAILAGEKRFEFRRSLFSRSVGIVVVYVTAPIKRVVAEFDIESVITADLADLWRRTRHHAGIDKEYFYEYFAGREAGHAIQIGAVRKYADPFCPLDRLGCRPPQSFVYLDTTPERTQPWVMQ